jgi:hypothetical protein
MYSVQNEQYNSGLILNILSMCVQLWDDRRVVTGEVLWLSVLMKEAPDDAFRCTIRTVS